MFGDLSPEKILVLGFIALIVLGPNRLPQAARSVGRFMGHLRAMSASFETEVRDALHDPTEALNAAVSEFRPGQIRRSVRGAITSSLVPPAAASPSPPSVPSQSGFDGSAGFDGSGGVDSFGGPGVPDDPSLN